MVVTRSMAKASSYGFKMLQGDLIATLEITGDTSEPCEDVVDRMYAKFRTNAAKVIFIQHAVTKQPCLMYKVGEEIQMESPEIYYFLSWDAAFSSNLNARRLLYSGPLTTYSNNGQRRELRNFIGGQLDGVCQTWNGAGQLVIHANLHAGKHHGVYRSWYDNGQLKDDKEFHNGEPCGIHKKWYSNGQLHVETKYYAGKLHGLQKQYFDETNWVEIVYNMGHVESQVFIGCLQ